MVGESGDRIKILINNQNRLAVLFQALQTIPDLAADDRGQPFGGFIEDQQLWIGHQGATNGQHLLFTTRQMIAGMIQPFRQAREKIKHPIKMPGGASLISQRPKKCLQIFTHRKI